LHLHIVYVSWIIICHLTKQAYGDVVKKSQYFSLPCGVNAIPISPPDSLFDGCTSTLMCSGFCSSVPNCDGFAFTETTLQCHLYYISTDQCSHSESTLYVSKVCVQDL